MTNTTAPSSTDTLPTIELSATADAAPAGSATPGSATPGSATPASTTPGSATPAYPLPPQPAPAAYAPLPKTNTLGIITLVLGVLGFGVVPVITGHIALNQIAKRREDGRGITLAGLILGYVTVAGWLAVALFWIAAVGFALFASVVGAR